MFPSLTFAFLTLPIETIFPPLRIFIFPPFPGVIANVVYTFGSPTNLPFNLHISQYSPVIPDVSNSSPCLNLNKYVVGGSVFPLTIQGLSGVCFSNIINCVTPEPPVISILSPLMLTVYPG